jgi:phosphopantetheinyl transferase
LAITLISRLSYRGPDARESPVFDAFASACNGLTRHAFFIMAYRNYGAESSCSPSVITELPRFKGALFLHRESVALDGSPSDTLEWALVRCDSSHQREVLRAWTGQDVRADPHGRPLVSDASISIAHTPTLLALAKRRHGRLGIDVEPVANTSSAETLPAGLSQSEHSMLMLLSPSERVHALTRLWTAKEALSKALGLGVSLDLSQLEFQFEQDALRCVHIVGSRALANGWQVRHKEVPVGKQVVVVAIATDLAPAGV